MRCAILLTWQTTGTPAEFFGGDASSGTYAGSPMTYLVARSTERGRVVRTQLSKREFTRDLQRALYWVKLSVEDHPKTNRGGRRDLLRHAKTQMLRSVNRSARATGSPIRSKFRKRQRVTEARGITLPVSRVSTATSAEAVPRGRSNLRPEAPERKAPEPHAVQAPDQIPQ